MNTQHNLDLNKYEIMRDAIQYSSSIEIRKLNDIKSSINEFLWVTDVGRMTFFQLAVLISAPWFVVFLINEGADLSDETFGGIYPFLLLAAKQYKKHLRENIEILLKNKLNLEVKDDTGRTPLHVAAANGRTELVELFLKYGAKVNESDIYGYTPLHEAAQADSPYSAIPLMKHGANFFAESKSGSRSTPLGIAKLRCEISSATYCSRGYGFFSRIEPLLLESSVVNLLIQGKLSRKLPIEISRLVSIFLPLETSKTLISLTKTSKKNASRCLDFDYLMQQEFSLAL